MENQTNYLVIGLGTALICMFFLVVFMGIKLYMIKREFIEIVQFSKDEFAKRLSSVLYEVITILLMKFDGNIEDKEMSDRFRAKTKEIMVPGCEWVRLSGVEDFFKTFERATRNIPESQTNATRCSGLCMSSMRTLRGWSNVNNMHDLIFCVKGAGNQENAWYALLSDLSNH